MLQLPLTAPMPSAGAHRSKLRRCHPRSHRSHRSTTSFCWVLVAPFLVANVSAIHHMKRAPVAWVVERDSSVPLVVSNKCAETIYPGILTQSGTPPSSSGFKLNTGETKNLTVSQDWQGRVWGRTNCSFNSAGTGPSNTGGNNGGGSACGTGDCGGVVKCKGTVGSKILFFHRRSV